MILHCFPFHVGFGGSLGELREKRINIKGQVMRVEATGDFEHGTHGSATLSGRDDGEPIA